MKIPISWLKKYITFEGDPEDLGRRLTMVGLEVEKIDNLGSNWAKDKVLVGEILSIDPHPNAERLRLPTVSLGNNDVTVVCGADNLYIGQKIAFAHEGASLISNRSKKIEILKQAKIRGIESKGMVCSEFELGLSEESDGILELPSDAPIGTPLVNYLGDSILDIDITPNRPDCLSVLGVAHEVAALTQEIVRLPNNNYIENEIDIESIIDIKIDEPQKCTRYMAILIDDITIGESPRWLKDLLIKSDIRPINNLVDITNFVMLEHGQPLHAFDLDKIEGNKIIVRSANSKERFTTLDNQERLLDSSMLVIADSQSPIALAGIMGGTKCEVDGNTKSIILESANFNQTVIRKTSSALKLRTEASYRFERGLRPELTEPGLLRATSLINEICGGQVSKGKIDINFEKFNYEPLVLTSKHISKVLGVEIDSSKVESILISLGFDVVNKNIEDQTKVYNFSIIPPYWRSDISIPEDLVEEVARIMGYDNIPTKMISSPIPSSTGYNMYNFKEDLRDLLISFGMNETISYNLTNIDDLRKSGFSDKYIPSFKVLNPMSLDQEYFRPSLRSSILNTLANNRLLIEKEGVKIFEIGKVFLEFNKEESSYLPNEKEFLAGLFQGSKGPDSWNVNKEEIDFFDAKGVIEQLFLKLNLDLNFETGSDNMFQDELSAIIVCNSQTVGVIGEVSKSIKNNYGLQTGPLLYFEIDLDKLIKLRQLQFKKYVPFNIYPGAYRDISLVVDKDVQVGDLNSLILENNLISETSLIDLYFGEGIPANKKSVMFSLVFESSKGTLTSNQIERSLNQIVKKLERNFGAYLRTSSN